jgi:tRNA-dihydrouridine synthase
VKEVDWTIEDGGKVIGRGIFGNPWLFSKRVKKENLQIEEILLTALEHAKRFEQELGQYKSFAIMKKHFKAYVNGFPGAKELRTKLMDTSNAREVEEVITGFIRSENSPFTKIKRYLKLMFS